MNSTTIATLLGLVRDLCAAVVGLLILFGVNLSDDQVAGILLVVTTAGALGSWTFLLWQKNQAEKQGTTLARKRR